MLNIKKNVNIYIIWYRQPSKNSSGTIEKLNSFGLLANYTFRISHNLKSSIKRTNTLFNDFVIALQNDKIYNMVKYIFTV